MPTVLNLVPDRRPLCNSKKDNGLESENATRAIVALCLRSKEVFARGISHSRKWDAEFRFFVTFHPPQ